MKTKDIVVGEFYAYKRSKFESAVCCKVTAAGVDRKWFQRYHYIYLHDGIAIEFVDPDGRPTRQYQSTDTVPPAHVAMPWAEWLVEKAARDAAEDRAEKEREARKAEWSVLVERFREAIGLMGVSIFRDNEGENTLTLNEKEMRLWLEQRAKE